VEDAYTIGITLALDNGVSAGVAAIGQDLARLDRALGNTTAGMQRLQEVAGTLSKPGQVLPPGAQPQIAAPPVPVPAAVRPSMSPEPAPSVATAAAMPNEQLPSLKMERAARPLREPPQLPHLAIPPRSPAPARTVTPATGNRAVRQIVSSTGEASPPRPSGPSGVSDVRPASPPVMTRPLPERREKSVSPPGDAHSPMARRAGEGSVEPRNDGRESGARRAGTPKPVAQPLPPVATRQNQSAPVTRVPAPPKPPAAVPLPVTPVRQAAAAVIRERTRVIDGSAMPALPPSVAAGQVHQTPVALPMGAAPTQDWPDRSSGGATMSSPPPPAAPRLSSAESPATVAPSAQPIAGTGGVGLMAAIPSAAPPASSQARGPVSGDVYLDGAKLGRWIADRLAREIARPQSGMTGFDPRLGIAWPGAPLGR
jgi:hypothetical protein